MSNPAVCINLDTFVEIEKDQKSVGQTIAHEIGHYLGLIHVFTNSKDKDDYCEDTYNYLTSEYVDECNRLVDEINKTTDRQKRRDLFYEQYYRKSHPGGVRFLSENIMDYYYSHANKLTPNQVERIRHSLYYSPMLPGRKAVAGSALRSFSLTSGAMEHPEIITCH